MWKVYNWIFVSTFDHCVSAAELCHGSLYSCCHRTRVCVHVMYLVSRLLGQQWPSLLHFGWLDVFDRFPCWLSVGVTRGVLFNHRHPLQHRRPAERRNVSVLHVQNKRFVFLSINYKNTQLENHKSNFSVENNRNIAHIPHVVIFFEQSIVFNCPLLELHIYTAAVDADDASDATGKRQREKAAVRAMTARNDLFQNSCNWLLDPWNSLASRLSNIDTAHFICDTLASNLMWARK